MADLELIDSEDVEIETETNSLSSFVDEINLVDKVPDIDEVASDIEEALQEAKNSMSEYLRKYKTAIDLATLNPESKQKTFPFEGASVAMMPRILEASIDFHSRAVPELVYGDKLVKINVNGMNAKAPSVPNTQPQNEQEAIQFQQISQIAAAIQQSNDNKEARAERVQEYMNYQLSNLIPKWKATQDKMLMMLPNIGTMFKKVYFDTDIQQVRSELVTPDKLIFDHNCDDFSEAADKFQEIELSRNEVISKIRGDDWDVTLDDLGDEEKSYKFYECLTWIDMDEDELQEPYVCIYSEDLSKIVSVKANYDEDGILENEDGEIVNVEPIEYFIQYTFMPDPAGGCMGMGWGILLSDTFTSINTTLRQLIDSSTLHITSSNSGLIVGSPGGKGSRQVSGKVDTKMGQLTKIQPPAGGRSLRESVVQFPFAGASPTLMQLMEYLSENARQLTVAASNVDANSGEAAQLYLARLQQGLKQPNSIIMRVYDCASKEYNKIFNLNSEHYSQEYYEKVLDNPQGSMQADFNPDDCDVSTVADPMQGSDVERVAKAEAVYQVSRTDQAVNQREATVRLFEAMNVPDMDSLVPEPDPNAQDPQQQAFIAQQAMEAELKQEDLRIRKARAELDSLKLQMEYEKMLLEADKTESEITKNYAAAGKTVAETNALGQQSVLDQLQAMEQRFIQPRAEGGNNDTRAVDKTGGAGNMAGLPSDQGAIPSV